MSNRIQSPTREAVLEWMGEADLKLTSKYIKWTNIKIVGLPEGTEGEGNVIRFFQDWLPEVLGPGNFQEVIEIDRAHRALRKKPLPGQKPRTVLIKFLRYQDKEKIMRLVMDRARERNGPLIINGERILFYPDISEELLSKRREFNPAKKIL